MPFPKFEKQMMALIKVMRTQNKDRAATIHSGHGEIKIDVIYQRKSNNAVNSCTCTPGLDRTFELI